MKVYEFFKIPDKDDKDEIDLECKYVLYAITNNKEYAKRFKEDRNMDKFIYKVHEGIDKEEYAELCNNERGAVLGFYPLMTVFNDKHTRKNATEKKVLMTYWEKQLTEELNTILDDEVFWNSMPYPLIFKSKYVTMLNKFQYISYYKIMTCMYLPDKLAEKLAKISDDYSSPNFTHDELSLFINAIKDTLI